MKNLKYYFEKAQKEKFAIGQFNFSDFNQIKAIVAKSKELKSPVLLATSEGEANFFGLEEAVALRNVLKKKTGLPIFLNLDHGKSFSAKGGSDSGVENYIKRAIDAGYDMVHFDGSKLSIEENIKITKEVVKYARWRGVVVEGEMGMIGTDSSKIYSEKFQIIEENLTKPEDAEKYIKETGVSMLAISMGNFHGIDISGVGPNLRINLLKDIKEKVGDKVGLVLHGGSGTPEDDIREAIRNGIVKININTELRTSFSGNLKKALEMPETIIPYKYFPKVQEAVRKVVDHKIKIFGSGNKI